MQLVELQSRYRDLQDQGLGVAVVTYDPIATLAGFARVHGIEIPLLSDAGSATIRAYGLLKPDPALAQGDTAGRLLALETRMWNLRREIQQDNRQDLLFFLTATTERMDAQIDARISALETRLLLAGLTVVGLFIGARYLRRMTGGAARD